MITALNLNDTIKYVLKSDTVEPKTEWILGMLDTRIRKKIEDMSWNYEASPDAPGSAKATTTFNFGAAELEYIMFGLKGFNNFVDSKGNPIKYKATQKIVNGQSYFVVDESIIKIIPENVVKELAGEIKKLNSIKEEEVKN